MRKFKAIALLLSSIMLFSACDSEEQKIENEKNLKQAEMNAVNYIEEKYGFTPKITEAVLERHGGMFGSTPDTSAIVRMNYNNKDFSVYIDGGTQNTNGADNYQQEEIISALTEKINEFVPQIKSINIDGGEVQHFYPNVEWNISNIYAEYFDGENFAEVFGDEICYITADYVAADFESLTPADFDFLLSNEMVRLYIISYRTEKDYSERPDYYTFTEYTGIKKHAIQIEESLVFEKGEAEHNEYILGKQDDFYYYVSDSLPDAVSLKPTNMPDASEFDGNGIIDGEFVTPVYSIDCSVDEIIYIYYPLSELPEKSRLATYSVTDEGEDLHISPLADDIGDYRMVYLQANSDTNEIRFAFITEKENINNEQ